MTRRIESPTRAGLSRAGLLGRDLRKAVFGSVLTVVTSGCGFGEATESTGIAHTDSATSTLTPTEADTDTASTTNTPTTSTTGTTIAEATADTDTDVTGSTGTSTTGEVGTDGEGFCGDGTVNELTEVCDDGENNGSYGACTEDCQGIGPHCGDGVIDDNEVCDDGVNDGSYNGCNEDCQSNAGYCGDGEINGPEQCESPGAISEDGQLCNGSCMEQCLFSDGEGCKLPGAEGQTVFCAEVVVEDDGIKCHFPTVAEDGSSEKGAVVNSPFGTANQLCTQIFDLDFDIPGKFDVMNVGLCPMVRYEGEQERFLDASGDFLWSTDPDDTQLEGGLCNERVSLLTCSLEL